MATRPFLVKNPEMTEQEYREEVASRLAIAIEALGITQVQAARDMDIIPQRLANWVKGLYLPDPYRLFLFYQARRVTPDWIWLGDQGGLSARVADNLASVLAGKQAR